MYHYIVIRFFNILICKNKKKLKIERINHVKEAYKTINWLITVFYNYNI